MNININIICYICLGLLLNKMRYIHLLRPTCDAMHARYYKEEKYLHNLFFIFRNSLN
jgi:hypothetical protein